MTKNEDRFLKITFRVLAFSLLVAAFLVKAFYSAIPNFNYVAFTIIFHFILSGANNALLASFFPKLAKATIIYLCFVVGVVGALPQLSPALFYLIPAILALYTLDKKFIFKITILNSVIFIISKMAKSYIQFTVINHLLEGSQLSNALLGSLAAGITEVVLVIGSSYLFFVLILRKNERLEAAMKEKKEATTDILHFCSTTTSYHNKYLRWHIHGVKKISELVINGLIEKGYKISDDYKEQMLFSVQFHDIGKIYIDSSILDKPGRLTDIEFTLIKEHPKRGLDLFNLIPKNCINEEWMRVCQNVILQHHEKLDGSGYPDGKTDKDISLEGKIIAVADVADALLSWRPYKKPMTFEKMMSIFDESRGKFLQDAVEVLREHKEELLAITDKDNARLQEMLGFEEKELERQG